MRLKYGASESLRLGDIELMGDGDWNRLMQQINQRAIQVSSHSRAILPTQKAAEQAPNWERMFCWLDEPARCGYFAPDFTVETDPAIENKRIGFRPMFIKDSGIPNVGHIAIATLYFSGVPVKIPKHPDYEGDIPLFRYGDKIEFRKPLDDPEYQITATAVGGKLIADYCVLRNILWNELKAQGF